MVNDVKANVDWDWVKTQYESGKSFRAIARELKASGVSINHQGMSEKARRQGWRAPKPAAAPVAAGVAPSPPAQRPGRGGLVAICGEDVVAGPPVELRRIGKRTPENINKILKLISEGASQNAAAKAVGVDPSRLSHWKREHRQLAQQIEAMRWHALGGAQRAVWKAGDRGDWRAAAHFLAHAPETKQEWGAEEGESGGIRIEFKFDRPPPMIDVTPKKP